jgi:hypothetical protein
MLEAAHLRICRRLWLLAVGLKLKPMAVRKATNKSQRHTGVMIVRKYVSVSLGAVFIYLPLVFVLKPALRRKTFPEVKHSAIPGYGLPYFSAP